MMTRQTFTPYWNHIRQMNGITMRLVDKLPADRLDARPIPNMRSPRELLVHLYATVVKLTVLGIVSGTIDKPDEAPIVERLKTKDDLVRFCRDCWSAADKAAAGITDAQLAAMVKTPWGGDMPGAACASIVNDELLHHRGQLYCFVRALGAPEVPMMWDFEHNAAEYQAAASATA